MQIPHFKIYTRADILSLVKVRRFETKLGERVQTIATDDFSAALQTSNAQYVIIGIPEEIGVLANYGIGGASTAWLSFLQSFLNIQSNDFFEGSDVMVAGHFDFGDLQYVIDRNAYSDEERINAYRHAVNTIDEEVEGLIKLIVNQGKIPVVIGGGHNNAYPLIKGAAKGLHQSGKTGLATINCINLDAHTDYRPAEGRHSGNAFRYAEDDGFLQKYCVVGVHESYLPQNVWLDIVNNPFIDFITYEDIFIHEKQNFRQAVSHAINFTDDLFTGIELDLDSIQNVLCSATSPSGLQPLHARQYINLCAMHTKPAYLHICEGAARISGGETANGTGKLISYLVADFIKMHRD